MNPIILLDEVDKVGDGRDGKATQNQLMELTDTSIPEWIDDYAKIGIDKQGMWFVLTANYEHQIDRVLKDRVQVIHVDGQTHQEKFEIVKTHILPKLTAEFDFQIIPSPLATKISTTYWTISTLNQGAGN